MQLQLRTVVNGAWIAARSIILTAIINAPYAWQTYYQEHGAPYANIQEPLMVPNDMFAILNTDEKGFFKLAQYAISQMQGRQPTSVVFGQNTLPWLAFKHNFMTEPERVGDGRARSALVNSNVAMRNVVAELGLAVYQVRLGAPWRPGAHETFFRRIASPASTT